MSRFEKTTEWGALTLAFSMLGAWNAYGYFTREDIGAWFFVLMSGVGLLGAIYFGNRLLRHLRTNETDASTPK